MTMHTLQELLASPDFDYFTEIEIEESNHYLTINHLTSREALLRQLLTRPQLLSLRNSRLLSYYRYYTLTEAKAFNSMIALSKQRHWTVVSPHTNDELLNATNIIFNFRDAIKEANIPPIALLVIADYYPLATYKNAGLINLIN